MAATGEGGSTAPAPVIDRERCKGCGLCVEFCPFGRLRLAEELNQGGYHPVVADVPGAGAGNGFFGHNFAFWCLRCRYCEVICPDAAIVAPGPLGTLEGAPHHPRAQRSAARLPESGHV